MKKILSIAAVALSLTACSTTKPAEPVVVAPKAVPISSPQEAAAQRVIDNVPEWFIDVPKKDNVIFAVGDGVSGSLSGAIGNARANAFEGICQAAGGKVRSQTKVFRQDTETSSTSVTTTAIRSLCPDVDVTGAVVEKRQVIRDGNRFRAYVLVALPMGEANTLARTKQADKIQEKALDAREREFKELDSIVDGKPAPAVSRPQSNADGITLMNVDNAEYKAKRDAALQKEGAVIGQTTLR
jgi:hypothetical protein